jgi:hypothetical protein
MDKKEKESLKRRYYKLRIRIRHADNRIFIFIFFLIISGTLWFLNALSKDYVTELDIPVNFVGIPREFKSNQQLPQNLTIQASGQGFSLMRHKITSRGVPFKFDIKQYFSNQKAGKEVSFQIITQLAQKQMEQYYGGEFSILDIYPRTISASFSTIVFKKLPVSFKGDLSFQPQVWQKGDIKITPDSVDVGGPQNVMDTVKKIRTQYIKIERINSLTEFTANLDDNGVFICEQPEVKISVDAEKFTEATIKLPIKVLNAPDRFNIMLFPDQTTVTYRIGIDKYESITANSFTAIVDYNQMSARDINEKIRVELIELPEYIRNVTYHPREVKYLIGEKK